MLFACPKTPLITFFTSIESCSSTFSSVSISSRMSRHSRESGAGSALCQGKCHHTHRSSRITACHRWSDAGKAEAGSKCDPRRGLPARVPSERPDDLTIRESSRQTHRYPASKAPNNCIRAAGTETSALSEIICNISQGFWHFSIIALVHDFGINNSAANLFASDSISQ